MTDEDFMRQAIELAKLGRGFTNPNPLVGAVIVKNGVAVAQGYHHKCGDLHAERDALKNARERGADVRGGTIFVTLEPCCHYGKQPPCTEAIIESGIKKVVIGSRDPNPQVNGRGVQILKEAGIDVVQDFLSEECDKLNPFFFHYIKTKKPYVIVKYAMTMDGQTATSCGESKWITGELARNNVHRTRSEVMAVMTGIGTVLKDDPMLNVRLPARADGLPYRQPLRIVLDSWLRIPLDSNIARTADKFPAMVFAVDSIDGEGLETKAALEKAGVTVELIHADSESSSLDIGKVLVRLGELGIDSVLVESGGSLNAAFFFGSEAAENLSLVQEIQVYVAPKIFGNDGHTINTPVHGKGIDFPKDAKIFSAPEIEIFGDDILLKYKPGKINSLEK